MSPLLLKPKRGRAPAKAAKPPRKRTSLRQIEAKKRRRQPRGERLATSARRQMRHLPKRAIQARYDAAATTDDNRKHWASADALSANAANAPEVRRLLRNRARYEVANNSYAQGIALTIANDTIGTGPRLQLLSPDENANDLAEALFADWMVEVDLAGKLRTARLAKHTDGEAFGLFVTNPKLSTVKLDVRFVEADRFTSPYVLPTPLAVDGIEFDDAGNPKTYHVLRSHPGDQRFATGLEADRIPAPDVLHYFTALRPEQARGIPEITSALPLFAQLRRYTLAVIAAAETAADLAMVIKTAASPNSEDAEDIDAMDTIELERRLATVLPKGWDLGQTKAEQPTTTYKEFKAEILNEIARCLNVPFNVAACNSSSYNYASGRLDHQVYHRALGIEQSVIERVLLNRIFDAWISEAVLIEGYLPQVFRRTGRIPRQWFWDHNEHVDPETEAKAQKIRLENGTTNRRIEYSRRGRDWRVEVRQRLVEEQFEQQERVRLGLPPMLAPGATAAPAAQPAAASGADGNQNDGAGDGGGSGDPAALKTKLDAVGLAVRSGLVTPQPEDEASTREQLGLPAMGANVTKAWAKDGGVRRPVTLAGVAAPAPAAAPAGGDDEPEA